MLYVLKKKNEYYVNENRFSQNKDEAAIFNFKTAIEISNRNNQLQVKTIETERIYF